MAARGCMPRKIASACAAFLAIAPRTGQNVAIFIREPLRPLAFDADGAHFHHALATLKVAVPGSSEPITFISAHLCPNGPEVRRREAAYLAVQAAPDRLTLVTGDFNSASASRSRAGRFRRAAGAASRPLPGRRSAKRRP